MNDKIGWIVRSAHPWIAPLGHGVVSGGNRQNVRILINQVALRPTEVVDHYISVKVVILRRSPREIASVAFKAWVHCYTFPSKQRDWRRSIENSK